MHNRLIKLIDDQKMLDSKQFGFQKDVSTSHAVISLTENTQRCVDDKQIACGVFIYLEKAFDTADHIWPNKYLIMVLEVLQIAGSNLT